MSDVIITKEDRQAAEAAWRDAKENEEHGLAVSSLAEHFATLRTQLAEANQRCERLEKACDIFEKNSADAAAVQQKLIEATGGHLGDSLDLIATLTAERDRLAQYQQFAAYCRSCALSGESDPQTFEQFVETMKSKETTRDTEA